MKVSKVEGCDLKAEFFIECFDAEVQRNGVIVRFDLDYVDFDKIYNEIRILSISSAQKAILTFAVDEAIESVMLLSLSSKIKRVA